MKLTRTQTAIAVVAPCDAKIVDDYGMLRIKAGELVVKDDSGMLSVSADVAASGFSVSDASDGPEELALLALIQAHKLT